MSANHGSKPDVVTMPREAPSGTAETERLLVAAVERIVSGQIVLYPTDTTYALGVNALDASAVERLFELKGRPIGKPIHVVVASLEMAAQYVCVTPDAERVAERFLPGPLTLVLKHRKNIPDLLVSGLPTLGIRMPNNWIALGLSQLSGVPITTTSANLSGNDPAYQVGDFIRQVSGRPEEPSFGMALDCGPLPHLSPSTLLDLTGSKAVIIREGPITRSELMACIDF